MNSWISSGICFPLGLLGSEKNKSFYTEVSVYYALLAAERILNGGRSLPQAVRMHLSPHGYIFLLLCLLPLKMLLKFVMLLYSTLLSWFFLIYWNPVSGHLGKFERIVQLVYCPHVLVLPWPLCSCSFIPAPHATLSLSKEQILHLLTSAYICLQVKVCLQPHAFVKRLNKWGEGSQCGGLTG